MQPDHASSSHWSSFSQNWFRPPMNSSAFFPMPGLDSDPARNMTHLPEQMIRNASSDQPSPRMPPHLSPCTLPSSVTSSFLPPVTVSGYYSLSPEHQDVSASKPSPYRVIEHGAVGTMDLERDYLNHLFKKSKSGASGGKIHRTHLSPSHY